MSFAHIYIRTYILEHNMSTRLVKWGGVEVSKWDEVEVSKWDGSCFFASMPPSCV